MAKIILSYRRSDARAMAGRIRDKLATRYGDQFVYMDVDDIPFGTDFRQHIDAALNEGDVLVAIIGPKWLGLGQAGQARIFEETDPVRVEIETALRRGIAIVPILIDGAIMPKPEELPDSIRRLSFLNAAEVDAGRDFHPHMERVMRSMDSALKRRESRAGFAAILKNRLVPALAVGAVFLLLVGAWTFSPHLRQQFERLVWGGGGEQTASPSDRRSAPARSDPVGSHVDPPPVVATRSSRPAAASDRRVALVIGNAAYQSVARLPTTSRDAAAVAAALTEVGFAVIQLHDVDRENLNSELQAFARRTTSADWAVVYYAGHGIELGGTNYLIPVDAKLQNDRDVQYEAVPLERVLGAVEDAKALRLIILDASRDNPFLRQIRRTVGTRAVGRGLAAVDPAGVLVAYAAKAGQVALDGAGENSPFAAAFVKRIPTPGLEVGKLFRFVRDDVMMATGRQQEPFVYGSLPAQDFYFVEPK